MARIAFFHNALRKTDGVSLEVDKWRTCLERMGHSVFYCAGNDDEEGVVCIPELSFFHPEANRILRNATVELTDYSEAELELSIYKQRDIIKEKLKAYIKENEIEVLIPNNLLSVGYHLPALIALSEIIEETGLPTISHNHDFYFEDSGEIRPTCPMAAGILERYVPAAFPNVQNLVINRLAQAALADRKGINATVVPNVFDFNQPAWKVDEYNRDFRETLGIGKGDILLLQATRVMNRKGIELAIDVVAEINRAENRRSLESRPLYDGRSFSRKDRVVLLCAGHVEEFGATGDYQKNLMRKAQAMGVDLRFAGRRIKHSRKMIPEGKVYSLWDCYAHADFVTYPSLWEGWGNQFIEAVFARLPVLLFEYPVFRSDLKADGFQVVSLGGEIAGRDEYGLATLDPKIVQASAHQVIRLLTDDKLRMQMVNSNFELGREKYSLEALQRIIAGLFLEPPYSGLFLEPPYFSPLTRKQR